MASELGQLFYSLGLEDKDFQIKIEKIKRDVQGLSGKDITLNTNASEVLAKVEALNTAITTLKANSAEIVIGDKIGGVGSVKPTLDKDAGVKLKTEIEEALKGITINGINAQSIVSSITTALGGGVPVTLTCNAQSVSQLVGDLIKQLNTRKVTIRLYPSMAKADLAKLKNEIETKVKEVKLRNVTVELASKKDVQAKLDKISGLMLPVEIKLHTNTLQAQLNKIGANITLNNSNLGGNGNGGLNERSRVQSEVNRKATDELGIRRSINDQMSRNTQLATMLGNTLGNVFAAYQVKNFLENLIQIGGEIQKQRMALGHIIDNISNANALFEQMKQLAVKSPFGLLDLMQNARQLSAFGVEYNQLYDTMKRLSDMAAGLGIQFSRLALAYGETKERGFLDGKLVRQFSYMGLPVLQKVAEYYTQIDKLQNGSVVTAAQVRSMVSDKQVSFEDVDAVIKKMTEEGGQFYNMQEVMAESVAGKWKNLKDAVDIMYSDIVEGNSEILKMPAELLTKLTKNYDQLALVLTILATRFVGLKGIMAMNTAIVNSNTAALIVNEKEMLRGTVAAIKKNGTFAKLTATDNAYLASIKKMNAAEFESLLTKGKLNKGDLERLIMMRRLTAEQKQYIIQQGIMTDKEVAAAAGATRLGLALRTVGAAIKSVAASSLLMIGAFAIGEVIMKFIQKGEKLKEFMKDVEQSMDDFKKATASVADEVNGLDFKSMSFGERETEIKNMVEYIKDNAPDAERKLAKIFETDENGKFKKDTEERFNALQALVREMEQLSLVDLSEWAKSARESLDQFDVMDSVEEWAKARATLIHQFNSVLGNLGSERRNGILDSFKNQYKNAIMDALDLSNEADLKKVSQSQLIGIITANKNLLDAFMSSNTTIFNNIINGVRNFKGLYVKAYDGLIEDVAKSMATLKGSIEGQDGKLNWSDSLIQAKWQRAIDITVTTEYKDKSSEEQKMIKQIMNNREILAKLSVYQGTADNFAKKVLSDETLQKNLYLNIISMFNGNVVNDPFKSFREGLKGDVDTNLTAAGDYETIAKQAKSATEALKNAKKASEMMKKVSYSNGEWSAKGGLTGDLKEQAEAFAGQMNTFEKNLAYAKKSAEMYGFSWDEIMAEVNKKGKSGGKQSDEKLKEWKEQFDELKKAYSEYQKWAAKVGKENAGKKVAELGIVNTDLLKMLGIDLKSLGSAEGYKKAVETFLGKIQGQLKSSVERKKFETSINAEIGTIELNIKDEAIKKAQEKAQREINMAAKQFDIWKSWFGATGDSGVAEQMAKSIGIAWNKQSEDLLATLKKELGDRKVDFSFGMNVDSIEMQKKFLALGTDDAQSLYDIWKNINDLVVNYGVELSKSMAEILKNSDDYEIKMRSAQEALNQQIDNIKNTVSDTALQAKLIEEAVKKSAESTSKMMVDSLKKSLNWDMIFSNLNSVSGNALNELEKVLEAVVNNSKDIDPTNLKTLYELLDKVRNAKVSKAGLFGGMSETMKELSAANNTLKQLQNVGKVGELADALQKLNNVKKSGDMVAYFALLGNNKKYKFSVNGKEEILTLKQYLDKLAIAETNVAKGATLMQKNMQEFANRMNKVGSIVKNTVSAMGISGSTSNLINGVANTFTGITSAVSNIDFSKSFFGGGIDNVLNNMDQMSSIASNIAGLVQTFKDAQKEAAQRQMEYYNSMRETLMSISDQIVNRIERALKESGGVNMAESVNNIIEENQSKQSSILETLFSKLGETLQDYAKNNSTPKTVSDNKNANPTIGHSVLWNMNKGNWGYSNWKDIAKEFGFDSLQDLLSGANLEQLYELQSKYAGSLAQNKDIAETVALLIQFKEEVDGINVSSEFLGTKWEDFRDSFVDACTDMSASADDLANNIYESLNNAIISTMVNRVFGEDIKKIYDNIGTYYGNDDRIDEQEMAMLSKQTDELAKRITEYRDQMKETGLLKDTESTSSSVSNSIKGVSEETADVLAAYMNGMRMDLSAQRLAVERIAEKICGEEGSEDDGGNLIAQAQLTQLQQIANHTLRNAEAAEAMKETLDAVVNGTKSWSIQ